METMIYTAVAVLFAMGAYGLLTRENMVHMVICINIMEAALFIFLVTLGYRRGATYPIVRPGETHYVDPLPHALTLTAIVIGAGITAIMLAFIIKLHRRYRTLDINEIRRLSS